MATSASSRLAIPQLMSGLRLVVSTTLLSRVLGALRDTATAGLFGLGPVMDAFAFAFRIPNLARRLFGEGALSAAFLPAFSRAYDRSSAQAHRPAWQLASAILTLLAGALAAFVLAGELLLAVLWALAAPESDARLLLRLTAIMLPYTLMICLAAQVTAILQALGRFGWSSFVPIVLNLCWLGGIATARWLAPHDQPRQADLMALAILAAGVLQLLVQLPQLHQLGFRFLREWRPIWGEVQDIARGIIPSTIALSITQINSILDSLIAWSFSRPIEGPETMALPGSPRFPLEAGSVSALYFGERIYQFPLGVFGVALGTVLFPLLARHAARGDYRRLRDDLSLALQLVLVVGIPASAGLMLVAGPLTQTLLRHGEFGSDDALRTARMVTAYSLGVWAYCGIPVLFRGFYAMNDRRTPLRIGMIAVLLDTVLNLTLIWPLAEQGLASSTALSAMVQVGLLSWLLQQRVGRLDWSRLQSTALKTILATAVMVVACLAVQRHQPDWQSLMQAWWPTGAAFRRATGDLLTLGIPVALGGLVYLVAAWLLRVNEVWLLFRRDQAESEHPALARDDSQAGIG